MLVDKKKQQLDRNRGIPKTQLWFSLNQYSSPAAEQTLVSMPGQAQRPGIAHSGTGRLPQSVASCRLSARKIAIFQAHLSKTM